MGSIPGTLANFIRGSVLLVAGVLTDSEDAISLGKQIASGHPEAARLSKTPSPEELLEMQAELEKWKQELNRAKAESAESTSSDAAQLLEELEKREAELKEIEDKHRQIEEDVWNYPRPAFLGEPGPVNIAVVGNSGVGKSLLINSFRGVRSGDDSWAPVGVNQTTTEPVAYALPGEPSTQLWDLAGAGSQQFPRGGYTRAIGLRHFDVVLVVTTCRFTQTEAVLLSELEERGVPSFVVRTMVDVDIASNEADHGQSEAETKRGILEDLRERGVPSPYLVNARRPVEHDFPKLVKDVLASARESRKPRARRPMPRTPLPPISTFEAGEMAEVWSREFQLWVHCIIERKCGEDEYDIHVPGAPPDARRVCNVPARVLRKAQSFEPGDLAEIVVLVGPKAGSWSSCVITSAGDRPGTYNVHIPDAPPGKIDLPNVPITYLRKATVSPQTDELMEPAELKEMLSTFRSICSTQEFQATIESLQERGTHGEEVKTMKRTLMAHQFNPTLVKFGVPATKPGWKDLLAFIQKQKGDPEVRKLAHEIERLVQFDGFFNIMFTPGEHAEVPRWHWAVRLKQVVAQTVRQSLQRSHQAAQAQAYSGAPMARSQRATAGYVDPMTRSLAFLTSAFRRPV